VAFSFRREKISEIGLWKRNTHIGDFQEFAKYIFERNIKVLFVI
jgi:hypothetical protein